MMNKYLWNWMMCTTLVLLMLGCELSEEKISTSSDIKLTFSTDTVLFDTLLTERTSITKRFWIRNQSKNAVNIDDISLGKGEGSAYEIIANGKYGSSVVDQVLFGGDSLLVLVDVTIDQQDENQPYLVKDSVVVNWNGRSEHVKLITWGQDAHYITSESFCDTVWTADRPYVVTNLALVDSACTLTIEKGTHIYFDQGATLLVQGKLLVQGDSGNHVVFRNTRFDDNYLVAPGQWGGIIFMETSTESEIHFADIENAEIGLGLGYAFFEYDGALSLFPEMGDLQTQVMVDHTSIRHMSTANVLSFGSDLHMSNCELYDGASMVVGCFAGGDYVFEHCTISNYPNTFRPEDPAFQFTNTLQLDAETIILNDLNLQLRNSIIWGSLDQEIAWDYADGAGFSYEIDRNVIRYDEVINGNATSNDDNYPGFTEPLIYDYSIDSLSVARNVGLKLGYETDVRGEPRDENPDIGAYERIDL